MLAIVVPLQKLCQVGYSARDSDKGVVLHAGSFGTARSDESNCALWDFGNTIAPPAPLLPTSGHFLKLGSQDCFDYF